MFSISAGVNCTEAGQPFPAYAGRRCRARAGRSTARSSAYAASGLPAPRYDAVGACCHDRADSDVQARDLVGTGDDPPGHLRDELAGVRVTSDVGVDRRLEGEDAARGVGDQTDALVLPAPVRRRLQRFEPVLDPPHRAPVPESENATTTYSG